MANCQLCGKKHSEQSCKERKGCSKCRQFTKHKAEDCPTHTNYPKYDQQVCDYCFSTAHEFNNCPEKGMAGKSCQTCGHLGHGGGKNKPCTLVGKLHLSTMKYEDRDIILDQFTPENRQKYLDNMMTAADTPTEAGPSSQLKVGLNKHLSDSAGPDTNVGEITTEEREKLWKQEETKLPRKPLSAKTDADNSVPQNARCNFFKIQVSSSVKLCRYSVTLGEIWPKKPLQTLPKQPSSKDLSNSQSSATSKHREETTFDEDPSNEGGSQEHETGTHERKVKPETKRYMIDQIMANVDNKNVVWATDYDATIISVGPVSKHPIDKGKIDIDISHTRSSGKRGVGPIAVLSKLTFLGVVDTASLNAHVGASGKAPRSMDTPENDLKALNIISWKHINDAAFDGGRVDKRFYPSSLPPYNPRSKESQAWKDLYVIRHGFFSSMRPGEGSILLNVNTVTTVFYADLTVQEWITHCWETKHPTNQQFRKKLKNVKVELLLHEEGRRRPFQLCGISTMLMDVQTFEKEDKSLEKVATYLKRKYPAYSQKYHGKAYCINVGFPRNPVWYPATELKIMKWQVATKDIPEDLNTSMIFAASKRPWQSQSDILNNGLQCLGLSPIHPFYSSFGLKPTAKLVELKAARLMAPEVLDRSARKISLWNGGWDFERNQFLKSNSFNTLSVISFTALGTGLKDGIRAICQQLHRRGATENLVQYKHAECTVPKTADDAQWALFRSECDTRLDRALDHLKRQGKVEALLVVLPDNVVSSLYSEVKRWSDCRAGIATTCIKAAKLFKAASDPKLGSNVCQKINFKLKGWSHGIRPSSTGKGYAGAKMGTMVVGADVTHPQKGSGCPSMAAVVATSDETSNQYLGSGRLQKGREEYIHDLRGMMCERVVAWVETNQHKAASDRLPKAILFFRDGVSESQFGMVRHEELRQIQEGCSDAEALLRKGKKALLTPAVKKWAPKITLIVVVKRHHARFYPTEPVTNADKINKQFAHNLPCGTVADTVVVTPTQWSFYLQSHHSGLGTARSALYVVLEDTAEYKPRELQMVTNNLCYTGSKAMRIISACAPARYADLLCERLRCYLRPFIDKRYRPDHLKIEEVNNVEVEKPYTNFVADPHIWMSPGQARQNPWHPDMDDVMFYL